MQQHEATLIAINIRKWDYDAQRISLTCYYVLDNEEKATDFDLSIIQPPEMVEEFLGKFKVNGRNHYNTNNTEEENAIILSNETFVRQKLFNYFKRILSELNNPKRKKGQSRMIFTTHMDVYNENQDISFLPQVLQFYVVLNWARKYYEKENYQRAVEPLRQLIQIKSDFGLAYKWLARSLKKIRKYDDAMHYYEKYAEVDDSLDAWLDLAKSYRKGKVFDKSDQIYLDILNQYPDEKEAKIGRAQIKFARNEPDYLEILDELHEADREWLKKWLVDEFNFRVYVSPKTLLTPVQAAHLLGYNRVFELTQRAFRNEVPSHFNPSKARMSFYKEELENWAKVMNRYQCFPKEIKLYPENVSWDDTSSGQDAIEDKIAENKKDQQAKSSKKSTKVEEIIEQIRAARAKKAASNRSQGENPEDTSKKQSNRKTEQRDKPSQKSKAKTKTQTQKSSANKSKSKSANKTANNSKKSRDKSTHSNRSTANPKSGKTKKKLNDNGGSADSESNTSTKVEVLVEQNKN